jgi:V8-like Glu-specific endopeptidase
MKKLLLYCFIFILFIGCVGNSNFIPEKPKKRIDLNLTQEIGLKENKDLIYDKDYIQPKNKSEKCLMLMEGSWIPKLKYETFKQQKIKFNKEHDTYYTWDGDCANGYAQGLGKLTHYSDGVEISYEIGNVKNGVSQALFVSKINNYFELGAYKRDTKNRINYRIITATTIKNNNEINNEPYAFFIEENKTAIGVKNFKAKWGKVYLRGMFGNGKFIGRVEVRLFNGRNRDYYGLFDINGNPIIVKTNSLYGTYKWVGLYNQIDNNKPNCGFYLYKDKNFNGYKEKVCIKDVKTLDEINNVIQNATNAAEKAENVFYLAKKLKEKYDSLHQIKKVVIQKKEPKKNFLISTGTGFIISKDGYILTNAHVIRGHNNIYAYLNKKQYKVAVILVDNKNDIALLKINGKFVSLPLNLKKAEVGEDIAVIGYPNIGLQGNEIKATFGEINSLSGIEGDIRLYQIDAPIQPGNSGSPLLNMKGEVIGIINATLNQAVMLKKTGTLAQNVNYAIKLSYALPLLYEANVKFNTNNYNKIFSKPKLVKKVRNSIVLILAK